jgi:co-chaperonin GroES (HSP10)
LSDSPRVFGDQTLEEAFPACEPGVVPFAEKLVVQIKRPPQKTKGGIHLVEYTKQTDADTCQIGKVIAIGPGAFRHRTTGEPFHEGAWVKVGDYVRVPKYLGDRWGIKIDDMDPIVFAIFKDLDLVGLVHDPLTIRSFI